jgi:hypothetical protein
MRDRDGRRQLRELPPVHQEHEADHPPTVLADPDAVLILIVALEELAEALRHIPLELKAESVFERDHEKCGFPQFTIAPSIA